MPGKEKQIIRIVKKKKAHAAHHGGSWKVAYADFVTAMMAFFMVMWLLSMDQKMKDAIEGYFSNPVGFKKGFSAGTNIISSGNSPAGEVKPPLRILIRTAEEKKFGDLAKDLRTRLNGSPDLRALGAHIEAVQTKSGLRIELIESGSGQTFFRNGSAAPLPITVEPAACNGCQPPSRSMIDSRAWANDAPAVSSIRTPSGPRCVSAAIIAGVRASAPPIWPAMPHIQIAS